MQYCSLDEVVTTDSRHFNGVLHPPPRPTVLIVDCNVDGRVGESGERRGVLRRGSLIFRPDLL